MKPAAPLPEWLNYHHLRHFWVIARYGHLTRAAEALRISPSTLSEQLAELEEWLGQKLFERRKRELILTEGGRVALEHAETIFNTGREMMGWFRQAGGGKSQKTLRLGAVGPLSKNLQFDFIQPLLADAGITVVVEAGPLQTLARRLREHRLDLVLSNLPMQSDQATGIFNHLLGEVPVFLAGGKGGRFPNTPFPRCLRGVPLFLPSRQSKVRDDFDLILAKTGIEPEIHAEVDDMALLRLLALSGTGLALVSKIVMERDLGSSQIRFLRRVPGLTENFYALTVRRKFSDAWLADVVETFRRRLKNLCA